MGTWGVEPFQSDGAGEWFELEIAKRLQDTIEQTICDRGAHGARDYQPGRAAVRCALMLCADGIDRVPAAVFVKGKRVLELALGDDVFLSSWRSRTAIEAELREELLAVMAAIDRHAKADQNLRAMLTTEPEPSGLRLVTGKEKPSLWPLPMPTRCSAGSSSPTVARSRAGTPSASTTTAGGPRTARSRSAITSG